MLQHRQKVLLGLGPPPLLVHSCCTFCCCCGRCCRCRRRCGLLPLPLPRCSWCHRRRWRRCPCCSPTLISTG